MKTKYVLIDYENVQPTTLEALEADHFTVIVFVGANQTKVTLDTAAALQRKGNKAEYIRISGNGPNALDFHIAFYIGLLATQEPAAHFHIISKDKGFDPLIQHLETKQIHVSRSVDVKKILSPKAPSQETSKDKPAADVKKTSPPKASSKKAPTGKLAIIVANLRTRGTSKPRSVKTLKSTMSSIFPKKLPEKELAVLFEELQAEGFIKVDGTKVSYTLPE